MNCALSIGIGALLLLDSSLQSAKGKFMIAYTQHFTHEFIPARKSLGSSVLRPKLMIVLHGRGDSLKPFRFIGEELGLPEMNYLLLNAPRKYDGGYTWYAFPPFQRRGILKARDRLSLMMEELKSQGWRSRDIFFFGFSQGCLISCDFALNTQEPLAGVIGVSGYLYFFRKWRQRLSKAAYQTPLLITHGLQDEDLPIAHTRKQVNLLIQQGLNVTWAEFNKEHEIDEDKEAQLIRSWVLGHIRKSHLSDFIKPKTSKKHIGVPLGPEKPALSW